MIGIEENPASSSRIFCEKVRTTRPFRYRDKTRAISFRGSLRVIWVSRVLIKTGCPPVCMTATSKERRVRVDGFSKRSPTVFPCKGWSWVRPSLYSLVLFQMASISEVVRSESFRKSLLLIIKDAPPLICFFKKRPQGFNQSIDFPWFNDQGWGKTKDRILGTVDQETPVKTGINKRFPRTIQGDA